MKAEAFLRRSFVLAAEARAAGDHPFGALLVVDGIVVAEALNQVTTLSDLTAHAELQLVRWLEGEGRLDLLRSGLVIASCEPCPMCVGALFWAGARHLLFGLAHGELTELSSSPGDVGFEIGAIEIGRRANPPMLIEGPLLESEARVVHEGFW